MYVRHVCTSALDDSKLVTAIYEHAHAAFSSKIVMERRRRPTYGCPQWWRIVARNSWRHRREREREREIVHVHPADAALQSAHIDNSQRRLHMCAKRVSWMDGIGSQLCHWFKSSARVIPCWKTARENGRPTVRNSHKGKSRELKIPLAINVKFFTRRGRIFFYEFIFSIIKIELACLYGILWRTLYIASQFHWSILIDLPPLVRIQM